MNLARQCAQTSPSEDDERDDEPLPESRPPTSVRRGRRTERDRSTEGLGPKGQDFLADRLRAVGLLLARLEPSIQVGLASSRELLALAADQERRERDLRARWSAFREGFAAYRPIADERRAFLLGVIDAIASHELDPGTRAALRTCRLHRPPLAKLLAIGVAPRM